MSAMVSGRDLILRCKGLGVSLTFDGDNLRVRAPSGVLSPELRAELKANKEAIREFLQRSSRYERPVSEAPPITKVPRQDELPLSFAQQRLWFLDQLEPDDSLYTISIALRLLGSLDIRALERSLREIVRRHESLRTTFPAVEGRARQQIAEGWTLPLPIIDLQGEAAAMQEAEVRRCVEEAARWLFSLAQGPLVRATLLRLSNQSHVLLLMMHHIVSDGWSVGVLVHELGALYSAFAEGRPSPLPELPVQYADFAIWQRQWLTDEVLQAQLEYWKHQLAGAPPALELPTDRPRPSVQTYHGASCAVHLPRTLSEALVALSRQEGVTLFMTLLAAFQTLLSRYTGQDDIVVGSPIAGRTRAEIEALIGFFVNTLVLRTDVAGEPTFRELLRRVREVTLGAYAHQDVPFEKLVEELSPERDASRSPLFQVMFVLQNAPMQALSLGELELSPLEVEITTAKFDLTLILEQTEEGIQGAVEYNTDLFDRATIERMLGHYQALLEGIVRDADSRISELPILTREERHQLLVAWNDTKTDYPAERCVHELFEAQVEKTPDAIAVVFGEQQLTYLELNRRANQLAHHLQSLGVGPEVLVGLCVERSLEMVVGLLGILKAGGGYVPLDPSYPKERLAFMLEDSAAPVLLTQTQLLKNLPEHQSRRLCLDTDWETIARESIENLGCGARSNNLAYVIYTSGSTGTPKGVEVTHRAVTRLVCNTNYISIESSDVIGQASNCSFDAATFEIWGALLHGARLVGLDRSVMLAPLDLARCLASKGVTVLFITTALFNQVAREAPSAFAQLKSLLFGGEAVDPQWVRRVLQIGSPRRLLHVYGPTETTTFATWYQVVAVPADATVPIGQPITNTRAYVLDSRLHLVPSGIPGELYIGGIGVARGYQNHPELTEERFLPDPFSKEPGARMYKTGDLCRWRPDGNLEFLGRLDHQVKIRGFRIELGEIECVLAQYLAVREAVVVAREDAPGDKRLVAYLVAQEGPLPSVTELRSHLQTKLPDYMIPAAFVELPALPLSPNGKIDRKALPVPDSQRPAQEQTYVAPRSPSEEVLTKIWAAALGLDQVGVFDNFFTLGGDSILAIQVISKAQAAGLTLSVRQIFQHQTIAALASVAVAAAGSCAEQGPVTGPVVLTPIQRWFFDQPRIDLHHFNQAVLLEVPERLDIIALERAVQHLVQHHDALRLRFVREGGEIRQANAGTDDTVSVTTVDLSAIPTAKQAQAIEQTATEVQDSLCLDTGPLMRVVMLDLGSEHPGRLLIVIHHLAVDGVSWRILLEDLETAYHQAHRGEALRLPPKTTSFRQWAERLAAHALSDAVRAELAYWRSLPPAPALPVDQTAGDNTVASARTVEVALDVPETRALLQDVPQVYRTQINDVLLLALAQALAPWIGTRQVRIDLEGHGREDIAPDLDLARTVGWFTTIFPVVLELPEQSLGEFIKSIKEQLRGIPNRGLGYGLLRYMHEDLAIGAELAAFPQAQVSFNYLGQLDQITAASSWLGFASESSGPGHGPRRIRPYPLDINGWVAGGRLHLAWTYSDNLHDCATIEGLAQRFLAALQAIVAHCRSPEAGGRTPSDFPLARLTQPAVDRLVDTGRDVEDIYPLSPMQQGMLFHSLRDPDGGLYVEQLMFRIPRGLIVPAFKIAWNQVLEQYPILRSAFVWKDLDEPLQIVRTSVPLPWLEQDWRQVPPDEQEARLATLLAKDRACGFELTTAPLMRLALIQLTDEAYQVVWSFHHVLLDGWSLPILFKELLGFYEAACQGQVIHLSPIRPYRDYIAWLQHQDSRAAEAFWREALRGFHAPTPLAVSRPSSADVAPAAPATQEHRLSTTLTEALEQFTRTHGLTLNTMLQGAWALLLSRYSGEDDVVFGATTSGRSIGLPGMETMVGLFINTLPVRAVMAPDTSVVSWLTALQQRQTAQLPHAHTPLAQVQGWSDVPRGQPLFESLLVVENYPMDEALGKGHGPLAIADMQTLEQTNYPLTVVVAPGREMLLRILYATERFDEATIERMLRHCQTLLEHMVETPERRLSELPILTAEEYHQLVLAWNDTKTDYPADHCVHALFEEQVEKTPEAVAVVFGEQQLTYRELNRRANQLAHHLQSLGVKPNILVGLCVERSLDMLTGILGILKAGGAYVPLDPTYPRERLAFMLDDSGAPVLLTQARLLEHFPESRPRRLCLDTDWDVIAQESLENPRSEAAPNYLAYVIYTSGSTGTPKGVAIRHHSLINLATWHQHTYCVTPHDRAPQLAMQGFDAAVWEIWPYLLCGASIHLVDDQSRAIPSRLMPWLVEQGITIAFLPTPLAEAILDEPWPADAALRLMLTGGDKLHRRPRTGLPFRLMNHYGPTESTVVATSTEIPPSEGSSVPPIGCPITNTQVYVLDAHMQPVPLGVPGELYIGGAGVARGYLNRPELTQQRFVLNPFSKEPDARLYKTGDLCRWRPDGNLEFLGRLDHQVKIRGFRIELGEIECVLAQHLAVREVAVVAREDAPGDKRLVAYLVAQEAPLPSVTELRSYLQAKLPDYMIPATFVELPALPLSPNGKVDRKALPAPDSQRPAQEQAYVAPRSPSEDVLAQIWAEVLRLDQVGVFDNFFALGGDSILAIQVISKAQAAGLALSVRQIFQHQTIAALASVAVAAAGSCAEQGPVTGPVVLTPIQRWFFDQPRIDLHHFNQAVLLEVPERLDIIALERAVQHLVQHHDALRLRFVREGDEIRQINAGTDDTVSLTTVDLSTIPAAKQARAIEHAVAQVQGSLRLDTGPLMRVALLDLGPERPGRLLIVIHHLAVDGVSWRILLEDLETAYHQAHRGEALRLPPKTTSFRQWAERLAAHALSDAVRAELAYWRSLPPAPALPVDQTAGDNTVASARTVEVALDVPETRALLQDVPQVYRTQINDVLLLALAQALAPWIGTRQVRIDLEGHGREDIAPDLDLSRTVGWFTTILPVVLELSEHSLGESLKSVKEQLRRIPNRGLGYGLLRYLHEDSAIGAELAAVPQAQVSFNYLGQLDQITAASASFGFAPESSGPGHGPRRLRPYQFDINGWVVGGRLHLMWTYSDNLHDRATIEALAQRFLTALQAIVAHCRSPEAGGRTPSDFPLARLTQPAVDRLVGTGRGVEDIYPLSPMQQGMLFHSLRDPDAGLYVEQLMFRIPRGLVVPAFKIAWNQLIERYPILRSAFVWKELDEPLQIVRTSVTLPWLEQDWRDIPADQREATLSAFLTEDRVHGFELATAPLMRLALIRLTAEAYQVVWSFHHVLIDGWSLPILFKELLGLYEAAYQGKTIHLSPICLYRDYIAWLQHQEPRGAEAFWREALRGFHAPTPLAVSRPSSRGAALAAPAIQQRWLSARATAALERFARTHGLTLNTVLQGAWTLLLSRYSGEDDVVFGATTSGRSIGLPGMETMVGLFINTLPVRALATPDASVVSWLEQLQERHAAQLPHAHTPLAQVQGWSDVPRGQPLFESLLVIGNYPVDEALGKTSSPLAIADVQMLEQTNYPITVEVIPGREMVLRISYAAAQFDEATIARMLGHYQALLEGIVEAPERPISQLPILTPEERHQLLVTWNDTQAEYPAGRCFHELFEAQVARTPERIAAVFEDQQLTYRELNRRANRLAHRLRALGVGPDTVVALLMHRGIELLTSILGIFKAGGAYLPLDPDHPSARLLQVLAQSGTRHLVTTDALVHTLEHVLSGAALEHPPQLLRFDALLACSHRDDNLDVRTTPDALAYVIFTSGSTGVPKGAMVEQRGMVNHLSAKLRDLELGPPDIIAQTASQCFDISVWQLLAALLVGGRVHILPPDVATDPGRLFDIVADDGVTILEVVPSLLRMQLEQLASLQHSRPALPTLRWLLLTGEALPPALCRAWFALYPAIPLLNAYGPTECSDDVTHHVMHAPPGAEMLYTPIGRPILNTQLYVLDHHRQPVPAGIAGELFVGGVGVGRGYLNDPERTAHVFLPDPFRQEPDARLYKTGDLCRWLPDGTLEFLGRIDHQVKIRGFRIELGEIESVLAQHPAVREVVVLAREDTLGDQRLVAYLVPREAPLPGAPELRTYLQTKLPDYMIPAAFVELPALPLSPNGKIDRKALPGPSGDRYEHGRAFLAPRDTVELELAGIWENLLAVQPIGVRDDFFSLGGHSLLAVQLMARIEARFGKALSLATLFQGATVECLAQRLREQVTPRPWSPLVAIQPAGQGRPFFCAHPTGGNVLCYVELAQHMGHDRPFYGLQAIGHEEGQERDTRIEDMAARYVEALRTVQPEGPYLLGGWSFGGFVAFEMAHQLWQNGHSVERVIILDTEAPGYSLKSADILQDDARLLAAIAREAGLEIEYEDLRRFGPDEQLNHVLDLMNRADLLPPGLGLLQAKRLFAGFKSNEAAARRYAPRPYPGRLTLFRAAEASEPNPEPTLGWSAFSSQPVTVLEVPGDHLSMVKVPHVQILANQLRHYLAEAAL